MNLMSSRWINAVKAILQPKKTKMVLHLQRICLLSQILFMKLEKLLGNFTTITFRIDWFSPCGITF